MALACLKCGGKIPGAIGSGWYCEGDKHVCRKCGARYVIEFTDDYTDDSQPYLVEAQTAPPSAKGAGNV